MLVSVRYDEIALKGGKRTWYERQLRENLIRQTGLAASQVQRREGRIELETGDEPLAPILDGVRRTFGVANAAVVHVVPRKGVDEDVAALSRVAIDLAREAQAEGVKSFKIDTRRIDKTFGLGSQPTSAKVGAAVKQATGLAVDVHTPGVQVSIEVRPEGHYVHRGDLPGPGGYPVGSAGRALALLSGGIDSPVAAWSAMKRGLHCDFVYFHAFPYTGDKAKEKVLTLAKELARWDPMPLRVLVVSTTKIQDAIQTDHREDLRVVLLRRAMYRLAGALARARGHEALVTGEALGQVASQTPANLLCVEVAVPDLLVLRPLITHDKREIVDLARRIGTFETSILPYQDCCSLFAPRKPATGATVARCLEVEAGLPLAELEAEALRGCEVWRTVRSKPFLRIAETWDAAVEAAEPAPAAAAPAPDLEESDDACGPPDA